MKIRSALVALTFALCSVGAVAGGGHDHGAGGHAHAAITSDQAMTKAAEKIHALAKAGKIDASWMDVQPAGAEQKTYAKGPEWVVTFKNDKVSDASKQTLYVFFSADGHYLATNYTGN